MVASVPEGVVSAEAAKRVGFTGVTKGVTGAVGSEGVVWAVVSEGVGIAGISKGVGGAVVS